MLLQQTAPNIILSSSLASCSKCRCLFLLLLPVLWCQPSTGFDIAVVTTPTTTNPRRYSASASSCRSTTTGTGRTPRTTGFTSITTTTMRMIDSSNCYAGMFDPLNRIMPISISLNQTLDQTLDTIRFNYEAKAPAEIIKSLAQYGYQYSFVANNIAETTTTTFDTTDNNNKQQIDGPLLIDHSYLYYSSSVLQRVPGCVANVNIQTTLIQQQQQQQYEKENPQMVLYVNGTSDAILSRGLLALLAHVMQGTYAQDILQLVPETMADRLGLRVALSQGRNDGLASMMRLIQSQIRELLVSMAVGVVNSMDNTTTNATNNKEYSLVQKQDKKKPTVAMLLSGGVDSAVALNILASQGYHVTAFYLKIWLEDELAHLGTCPWEDDYNVCVEICQQANVPLESISLQQEYKDKVISYTIAQAQKGRTPNPDIMCNSRIKFGCFYDAIQTRGFDFVASGHYAQVNQTSDDTATMTTQLLRAPDPIKDQSYFLCALSQQQLQRVLFPIGHLEKHAVRQLAEEYNLPNKNRPDSQGLCFLGKVKFEDFLAAYLGESPGNIIDAQTGMIIGRHKGLWFHTVGQRKGIGKVLDPKATARGPWYVVAKDPKHQIVYASNEYDEQAFAQARSDVFVEDIHWISGSPPASLVDGPARFDMKIRHGPRLVTGSLELLDDGVANVKLDQKDGGLAPGQYVVFYEPDGIECYGGGVISERHWARFLFDQNKLAPSSININN